MSIVRGTRSHALILMRVVGSSQIVSQKTLASALLLAWYQLGVSSSFSLTSNTNG